MLSPHNISMASVRVLHNGDTFWMGRKMVWSQLALHRIGSVFAT
jgi:hypothetical protein